MIRVDSSDRTHLAVCSKCPPFREIRGSKAAAWAAGLAHAASVHPKDPNLDSLQRMERRHRNTPEG